LEPIKNSSTLKQSKAKRYLFSAESLPAWEVEWIADVRRSVRHDENWTQCEKCENLVYENCSNITKTDYYYYCLVRLLYLSHSFNSFWPFP